MLLPQYIKCPVAADGEQPLSQVPVDRIVVRCTQFQERLLNHVVRGLRIAEQARGVEQERCFKASHRVPDPRFTLGVHRSQHRPAWKGTVIRITIEYGPVEVFLESLGRILLRGVTGSVGRIVPTRQNILSGQPARGRRPHTGGRKRAITDANGYRREFDRGQATLMGLDATWGFPSERITWPRAGFWPGSAP